MGTSDLSEISEDEDAINVDVMREFKQFDNMHEQTETNGTEFSASACQKIHSELLASVNQIYLNLQDSGLKTNSSSSSSLSGAQLKNKTKIAKTRSIELKANTHAKTARSMSIAEITYKKKATKKLKKKVVEEDDQSAEENLKEDDLSSRKKKMKKKGFASGKMEVFIKPKKKSKRSIRLQESEP